MGLRRILMVVAIVMSIVYPLRAAEPVTIKMMDIYGKESISDIQAVDKEWGEFKVDINIGEGVKKPQYNGTGDVRLMYYNTITIKSPVPMTEISFQISAQGLKQFAEITASVGEIKTQGANPLVWKGNAETVTFTVGRSPKYSNSAVPNTSIGGQLCFLSIDVTTAGGLGSIDSPQLAGETESGVMYFDLRGVPVNSAEKGEVLIRIQNGKAQKVIF